MKYEVVVSGYAAYVYGIARPFNYYVDTFWDRQQIIKMLQYINEI